MQTKDICITGYGLISALGCGEKETLDSFEKGLRNFLQIPDELGSTLKKKVFAVKDIPEEFDKVKLRTLSLTLTAVDQALKMSGLDSNRDNIRVGVCLGTTVASQLNDIDFYRELKESGTPSLDAVYRYLSANLAEAIAQAYDFNGPTLSVVNACSSGTDALGIAKSWIDSDLCDVVIAGGADEINRVPISGFNSLSVYSDELCAPFDVNRNGLNLGEGAGVLVLESLDACDRRKSNSLAKILGYGTAIDAYHLTAPRPDGSGLEKAINSALKQAKINAEDIALVNAHGTATKNNDIVEGQTLSRVFAHNPLVLSTKGYTGHTLGAAGGLEAVFCVLALLNNWVPANVGLTEQDPEINLNIVKEKTTLKGDYAISTSLAFGGNNSAVIIGRK